METCEHSGVLTNRSDLCKEVYGVAMLNDVEDIVFTDMGSRQVKTVSLSTGEVKIVTGTMEPKVNFLNPWEFVLKTTRILLLLMPKSRVVKLVTDITAVVPSLRT
jgi:hypothetical protein